MRAVWALAAAPEGWRARQRDATRAQMAPGVSMRREEEACASHESRWHTKGGSREKNISLSRRGRDRELQGEDLNARWPKRPAWRSCSGCGPSQPTPSHRGARGPALGPGAVRTLVSGIKCVWYATSTAHDYLFAPTASASPCVST